MSSALTQTDLEIEQDRLQREAELDADEGGPDWRGRFGPGTFGCHELLDRTALLNSQVEEQLLAHPACILNPKWFALAEQAAAALRALYQRVGADHLDADGPAKGQP